MKIRELRKVSDVVEAIGRKKLMKITGRASSNVSNWIGVNRFPPSTYVIVTKALEKLGHQADPQLWGMEKQKRAA